MVSVNTSGCSLPEATVLDAVDQAIATWNEAPNSGLRLDRSTQISTTSVSAFLNGTASDTPLILCDPGFSSSHSTDGDVIPAATQQPRMEGSGAIYYAGMVLNSESGKAAEISQLPASLLVVTIAHEMGHILGLGHSSSTSALMYYSISDKPKAVLTEDDRDGISYLYPRNEFQHGSFGCASTIHRQPSFSTRLAVVWFLGHIVLVWGALRRQTWTTSFTWGTTSLRRFSTPILRVAMELGQELHEPCRWRYTIPSSNRSNTISPPSMATAGRISVSSTSRILLSTSEAPIWP